MGAIFFLKGGWRKAQLFCNAWWGAQEFYLMGGQVTTLGTTKKKIFSSPKQCS